MLAFLSFLFVVAIDVAIANAESHWLGLRSNENMRRRLATWTQIGSQISGSNYAEWSGSSVALSGNGLRVAIGAPGNDSGGTNAGCVRVYSYASSSWTQMGSTLCGNVNSGESGTALSFNYDGTVLAVGAPYASSGKVYIYQESGGSWSESTTMVGVSSSDQFGMSVSFNGAGTMLAVGAPGYDSSQSDAGRAYIFTYASNSLTQVTTFTGTAASDNFGNAVSLNSAGTILAVGIPGADGAGTDRGEVKVYQNSGSWAQLGSSIAGTTSNEYFGKYLSVSGDGLRVAIAAPAIYSSTTLSGRVAVYEYSGSWSKVGSDMSGGQAGYMFGRSVALSSNGNRVVIGETYYSTGGFCGTQNGRTSIYDYSGSSWSGSGSQSGDCSEESFGYSSAISCDGTVVAAGAANGLSNNQGYVYVYSVTSADATCVSGSVSSSPTRSPTLKPTLAPSISFTPTRSPTSAPTLAPSISFRPTTGPTSTPTRSPTLMPTMAPTTAPTISFSPTSAPTMSPTRVPTLKPTMFPTSPKSSSGSGSSSSGNSFSSTTIIIIVAVVIAVLVVGCACFYLCSKRSSSKSAVVPSQQLVARPPVAQPQSMAAPQFLAPPQVVGQPSQSTKFVSGPRDVLLCHDFGLDSLERSNHARVVLIDQALRRHQLSTWCRDKSIDDVMTPVITDNVDNSKAAVIFITKAYVEGVRATDSNLAMEFNYVRQHLGQKRMIAVVMEPAMFDQKLWKGSTGAVLGDQIFVGMAFDFNDSKKFDDQMSELVKVIRKALASK